MVYIRESETVGDKYSTCNDEPEREKTKSKAYLPATDLHGNVDKEQRYSK